MNRPKWYYHVLSLSALLLSLAALLAAYRYFAPLEHWTLDSDRNAFNPRTAVLCGQGVGALALRPRPSDDDAEWTYISCRNWQTGARVHLPGNPFAESQQRTITH